MFLPETIVGIEELQSRIPEKLQHWCEFGLITDLKFYHDIDDLGQDIRCIKLVLSDSDNQYRIGLYLQNVSGEIRFNAYNGFGNGFDIEDNFGKGWEKSTRYHLYSFEMDADPDIYCEKITVELL